MPTATKLDDAPPRPERANELPADSVVPGSVVPGSVVPGSIVPGSIVPGSIVSSLGAERCALCDTVPLELLYDHGVLIRSPDDCRVPFALRVNGRAQFRHTGFTRDITEYSDRTGQWYPVENRNDFEIERARLVLSGHFLDPRLGYWVQLNADTDDSHVGRIRDFWLWYEFDEAFRFHVGKAQVPGSREWLTNYFDQRLADRSLATTFFRPGRSVGVWATGTFCDDWHYRGMIANGFWTDDLAPAEIDREFAYSGSLWWEPLGCFGEALSDLDCRDRFVLRVGNSLTFAPQRGSVLGPPWEAAYARLSDGTILAAPHALAAGTQVTAFDTWLYAVDLAAKWKGIGLNAEFYFRWFDGLRGVGALPVRQIADHGFVLDVGYFVRPNVELATRCSAINGAYGDRWEFAAGVNWFLNGNACNRLTFDVTVLDGSPVHDPDTNYTLGQDGVMFRTQWTTQF